MPGDSVDVVAAIYHTENGVEHAEGDAYAVTDRPLAETLRAIGFVTIEGWTELAPPAAPVVASLSPSTAAIGALVTLHVVGTGFVDGDAVQWNGAASPTTFVSATELTTPIDLTAAAAGPIPVSVQSANGPSNALSFTVTAATR